MTHRITPVTKHVLREIDNYPNKIFGLVSAKPLIPLVWNLTQELDIPFQRINDLTSDNQGDTSYWQQFNFFDPDTESSYSIIKNRGVDNILAPELRNVDVFLVETNYSLIFNLSLDKVSKTRFVDFCFEIKDSMLNPEASLLLKVE